MWKGNSNNNNNNNNNNNKKNNDINSLEDLIKYFKIYENNTLMTHYVLKKKKIATNKELWHVIVDEWNKIPNDVILSLYRSMHQILASVMKY